MKIPDICKTCKYVTILSHGIRCRKKVRARYLRGKFVCSKYRIAKRHQKSSVLG